MERHCWQQVNLFVTWHNLKQRANINGSKIQYFPDPLGFSKSCSPARKALNKSFGIATTFSKDVGDIEKGCGLIAM
jgi:hypothetical protein